MKLKNLALLGIAACATISLAGCTNTQSNTVDTSVYSTDISKNWFSNGKYSEEYTYDENYTVNVYDPTSLSFTEPSYYRMHAPSDCDGSLRMIKTPIDNNTFGDNKENTVKYLQCSPFAKNYQNQFAEHIEKKASMINSLIFDFKANVQTTWSKNLADYNITKDSLSDTEQNYLYTVYLPIFVRVYSNSTLSIGSFICVPVYTTVSVSEENSNDEVVKSFKDKEIK